MNKSSTQSAWYDENIAVLTRLINDVAIFLNLNLDILEFNAAAELFYDWKAREVIGKNYTLFCQKHSFNCPLPLNTQSILSGEAYRIEQLLSKGSSHYLSWSITRILGQNFEPKGYLLLAKPALIARSSNSKSITENNNDLSFDRTQLISINNIISNLPENIYWKDKRGIYLGCNDLQAKNIGLNSPSEVVGLSTSDIANRLGWKKKVLDHVLKTDSEVLNDGVSITVEERSIWISGQESIMLSRKVPLKDKNGFIVGLLGISTDITYHKKIESELQKAKLKAKKGESSAKLYLQNIVANLPDHVYWADKNGVYLGCNEEQGKSVGGSKNFIGKTIYDIAELLGWDRKLADSLRENDIRIMNDGLSEIVEEDVIWTDGKKRTFLSRKACLKNEKGEPIGIIGISTDINERKLMENKLREAKELAETANRAKSDFIASMSHDLKTPLVAILGITEIFKDELSEKRQVDLLKDLTEASNNILSLVKDILGLSKLESGKIEFSPENFDLCQLIENIVSTLSYQALEKNLDLIISYPRKIPRLLISDPTALRRIIINLLSNAIKFTKTGYINIRVEPDGVIELNPRLKIIVEDTGIGISEDQMESVFDRFTRVDPSYRGQYQGTGLGLSIVKQLVSTLGGTVTLSSILHQGSTFTCSIPFKSQKTKEKPSDWESKYEHVKILLVNEFSYQSDALRQQLSCNNMQICSGNDAMHFIFEAENQKTPYQIIIIDNALCSLNALELAKKISEHKGISEKVLIYLSAPLNLEKTDQAKSAGFKKILIKPIGPTELYGALMNAWENHLGIKVCKKEETESLYDFEIMPPPIRDTAKRTLNSTPKKVNKNLHQALLVEDSRVAQKVTKIILEKLNCQVDIASNGNEALELNKLNVYDIIFLDIGLPDIDGIEVCKIIRKTMGENQKIPIVALSGHIIEREEKTCLEAGMDAFMEKPALQADFVKIMKQFSLP